MVEKPMDLLKGLDDINWSELSHAYGPATDVPENLRKLLSIDKEEWENAYGELAHSIWHQGTVYSVTEFVVPFLIKLLESDVVINRHWILFGLLSSIAGGHSYFDVHYHLDPVWADKHLAEQGTDIEAQLQKELGYVKRAREAVLNHSDTYIRLLNHEMPELVVGSVTLLSDLVELSAELFPRFKQLYGKDSRLWTRNSILHGVRKLKISSKTKNEFFMPIFEQEHEHLLKGAAALGAFESQQSNYRSEIFDYLVNYCQFLEQEAKWNCLDSDPWGGPSICIFQLVDACLLLSSSSNIEEVRHLALVLEKPSNVFELVEKLFFKLYGPEVEGRVFSTWALEDGVRVIKYCKGTNDKPVELIKYQTTVPEKYKRVIELVLQLDKFWEVKSNLLNVFGFPHSRYELGEIV